MTDTTQPSPQLTPEQQAALQHHSQNVNRIVEIGREAYGDAQFDADSQTVAEGLDGGLKAQTFMALAAEFDRPHDIINHLANNPDRLKEFAKLSPQRQMVEMSRIEAQMAPHGQVRSGVDASWKRRPSAGRISEDAWRTGAGQDQLSDAQWSKEWERRMAERAGRRR